MVKLSIFTGTRAEYGLMKNLIRNLQKDNFFNLNVIVAGTHLEEEYGNTINELKKDGININSTFSIPLKTNLKQDMAYQTSEIINTKFRELEQPHDSSSDRKIKPSRTGESKTSRAKRTW